MEKRVWHGLDILDTTCEKNVHDFVKGVCLKPGKTLGKSNLVNNYNVHSSA